MIKKVTEYGYIAAGSLAVAVGINLFLLPINISTGGISGVGTILYHTFNIPLWVTTLVLNIILFLFGYRTLEKDAMIKTAAGIVFLSLFLALTENIGSFGGDILISAVFGGILAGAGVGLTVFVSASTGGSDFAALMLHRIFPHISVAGFIMTIDLVVIVASGIVFQNYNTMFYSVISLYISSKITDRILVSGNFAKCLYIISSKYERIADSIMTDMDRGVTGIRSVGLYTRKENMTLMCIVSGKEVPKIISTVKSIDENAFTVISDVREVHGEGFIRK